MIRPIVLLLLALPALAQEWIAPGVRISEERVIAAAPLDEPRPAMVFSLVEDGDGAVAFWWRGPLNGKSVELMATRLDANGASLETKVVGITVKYRHAAAAARAGNGFVIVYIDEGTVYSARIDAALQRAGDPQAVGTTNTREATAVDCNATSCFAFWNVRGEGNFHRMELIRLSHDGAREAGPVTLSRDSQLAQIAAGENGCLVTWNEFYYVPSSYWNSRYELTTAVLDRDLKIISTRTFPRLEYASRATVAPVDGGYLFAWNDDTEVRAARLDAAGKVLGETTVGKFAIRNFESMRMSRRGAQRLLLIQWYSVWQVTIIGGEPSWHLHGARITEELEVVDPAPFTIATRFLSNWLASTVPTSAGHLVTWNSGKALVAEPTAHVATIGFGARPVDFESDIAGKPFVVAHGRATGTLYTNGSEYLRVSYDPLSLTTTALRLDRDFRPLDAAPRMLATRTEVKVDVASDGRDYLALIHSSDRGVIAAAISGADGSIRRRELPVKPIRPPQVVWAGSAYVAVSGDSNALALIRIAPDGTLLSSIPLPPGTQFSNAALAADGDAVLYAWSGSNHGTNVVILDAEKVLASRRISDDWSITLLAAGGGGEWLLATYGSGSSTRTPSVTRITRDGESLDGGRGRPLPPEAFLQTLIPLGDRRYFLSWRSGNAYFGARVEDSRLVETPFHLGASVQISPRAAGNGFLILTDRRVPDEFAASYERVVREVLFAPAPRRHGVR